jgi:acetyl esterase/lipase
LDQKDFFVWVRESLQEFLANQSPYASMKVDTARILVTGDSAGGYLTLLTALHQPVNSIRAVVAAYPCADLQCAEFNDAAAAQKIPAFGAPILPANVMQDYIGTLTGSEVITDAVPPGRFHLLLSASQQGMMTDLFGREVEMDPLRMLNDLAVVGKTNAKELPNVVIWHGTADTAIPFQGEY